METHPYLIDDLSAGQRLTPIDPSGDAFPEKWLQDLLIQHPDILPVGEIEPVFAPLIPIGREVLVSAGSIDNLFISPQGYPVIVETKLWRNPDARRDVLAQLIDYASSISNWTFENINSVVRNYTRRLPETKSVGLIDWVRIQSGAEIEAFSFEETVSGNLRLGRIMILVVGDRIRSSVVEMLSYINKYPHLAMNAALIELNCFKLGDEKDWPLLVVPSILAKTQIVERTIVQVNVSTDGSVKLTSSQEKPTSKEGPGRIDLSEDDYWEQLAKRNIKAVEPSRKIIEYFRSKDGVVIVPRSNSIAVHLYPPVTEQCISLFFIRTDGILECWHATVKDQLRKAGLDPQFADAYRKQLSKHLDSHTKSLSISGKVTAINCDGFIETVDEFIDHVIEADAEVR